MQHPEIEIDGVKWKIGVLNIRRFICRIKLDQRGKKRCRDLRRALCYETYEEEEKIDDAVFFLRNIEKIKPSVLKIQFEIYALDAETFC